MKKEQLLNFIPKPEEKYTSTHQIALKAKIHDYVALALLVELANMPRPLVQKFEFGKRRMHRIWKQTKIETEKVDRILKLKPQDRDNEEHLLLCRDKYWGRWHDYIIDIVNSIKSEIKHPEAIVQIK